MSKSVVFFDLEISKEDKKIKDIGAVNNDKGILHTTLTEDFCKFIEKADFLCGHNAVNHDMKYLAPYIKNEVKKRVIDTLYISPLLFPKRPYHRLLKNDKLFDGEFNNPVNDSQKAQTLFYDEVNAFWQLSIEKKKIFCGLLYKFDEFKSFFDYMEFKPYNYNMVQMIKNEYKGKICDNADLEKLILYYPIELAYSLALIGAGDLTSITPKWLLYNYPKIENTIKYLCGTPCGEKCEYCLSSFDVHKKLTQFFGEKYTSFREFEGEPLQEKAVRAAVEGKSIIVVFPTGGGKSLTFQLPALMANETTHGLTVVVSPLQSLMKDQVDNLSAKGIDSAVTINGAMSPIERQAATESVTNGSASLVYISPEQLRSKTIKSMLKSRNIARFVIDEAHCFSAWGQDFRVEYLYIADAIKEIQKAKKQKKPIPVSCFTATAKKNVITDIKNYFFNNLGLELEEYSTRATRKNLSYTVIKRETDIEKYNELRRLIEKHKCPTIVYVSRTKKTEELAKRLCDDGYKALPYHGKMESHQKVCNQDEFMRDNVQIMVATSAFGMGVDKSDVGLVVHYEISDSLENYVQEAGRAGRDSKIQASCYILYNVDDLDKHFIRLNQNKVSISQIQQVWRAIKNLTPHRLEFCRSALEIAREAGWNDQLGNEIETRVKTALHALQNAKYIERGDNMPKVFATSILAKTMKEAREKIDKSNLFDEKQKENTVRIMTSLFSRRSIATANDDDAESRVDYLADNLGLTKETVIESIDLMKRIGLLENYDDMSAYIDASDTENRSSRTLEKFAKLERFLISSYCDEEHGSSIKEINESAHNEGIKTSNVKAIRTVFSYLTNRGLIEKDERGDVIRIGIVSPLTQKRLLSLFEKRIDICRFILNELYAKAERTTEKDEQKTIGVDFSTVGLFNEYSSLPKMTFDDSSLTLKDIEDSLLYLSKIGALKLEGGFLVLYNGMKIRRLEKDKRIKYKVDDYKLLEEFYQQKIRQIHIVGEYAELMDKDVTASMKFVDDYFQMDYKRFIAKYFKGDRAKEIEKNITPQKYELYFGSLSDKQEEIVSDGTSDYIVVAAGPGSGKTRVLVHKLASLYQLEDVKHEQMLMLTFSRAAATEFKKRLRSLLGNAANFIEIKTFHSYCFDLLGRPGNLDKAAHVVKDAVDMINNGEVEQGKITKSVLVIDEAQDMDENEFELVRALMNANDDMRVIAVGDDDQNVYEFRGSDSKYLKILLEQYEATMYEMTENYRSKANIVALANDFAKSITNRMKSKLIEAVTKENGNVRITRHKCANMEKAVVNELITTYKSGKVCVLTNTNDEALRIFGLLLKYEKRAKLIQSLNGIKLRNLLEIRIFLDLIDRNVHSPIISDDVWCEAKKELFNAYKNSTCIDNVKRIISDFEATHSAKYRTDFEEYLNESEYDDFYDEQDHEVIYVSTIHKSKGREFDNVYMMLKNSFGKTDAERRALYVGMTRAKNNLYIHTNTALFDKYRIKDVEHIVDDFEYESPDKIVLQTTHKDVVLDFFKNKKDVICSMLSGTKLKVDDVYLTANVNGKEVRVAKLSKGFVETLKKLREKCYMPEAAEVRFVVFWKGEDDTEETPIILADIFFVKKNS